MGKMTPYLNPLAKAVNSFYDEALKAASNIARNNGQYLPDIAKAENEKELERIQNLRWDALDDIAETEARALYAADTWAKLSAKELTDDVQLLKLFDLSPSQFDELVDKYRDNGTMTALFSQYAEKKNAESANSENKGLTTYYNTMNIPTAEMKKEAFRRFTSSARDLIARIADKVPQTIGPNTGLDTEFIRMEVEGFGKENTVNSQWYNLL